MKKTAFHFFISFLPLVLLFACTYNSVGQTIRFKHLSLPAGISMGSVTGIAQDPKGYMWFGGDGLFRYDGYQCKAYKNDPMNPNSLGSNVVETICTDKDGIVWIGTKGYGLDRFDPVTGRFTHLRHNPNDSSTLVHNKVTVLLPDHNGFLWIGTHGGLDRMDLKTGKIVHYRHKRDDPNSLSCDQVRAIYEDRQGTLWVGTGSPFPNDDSGPTDGGLNRFDQNTGEFTRYVHDPKDPTSLINNKVGAIFEDSRGNFWVGSAGDGLHTMDRKKGVFERHLYDPSHPDKLSRPPLRATASYDHIRFVTEDAAGYIWIGTVLSGLNRYDPRSGKVEYFGIGHRDEYKQTYQGIPGFWSAYSSYDGVLWISVWQGDVYFTDPLQKDVRLITTGYSVNSIYEESKDVFWMGTGHGLIRHERTTGLEDHFITD
jgi:ligand-binding sensor domain-containing protein